jgi:hypothetical protein
VCVYSSLLSDTLLHKFQLPQPPPIWYLDPNPRDCSFVLGFLLPLCYVLECASRQKGKKGVGFNLFCFSILSYDRSALLVVLVYNQLFLILYPVPSYLQQDVNNLLFTVPLLHDTSGNLVSGVNFGVKSLK